MGNTATSKQNIVSNKEATIETVNDNNNNNINLVQLNGINNSSIDIHVNVL